MHAYLFVCKEHAKPPGRVAWMDAGHKTTPVLFVLQVFFRMVESLASLPDSVADSQVMLGVVYWEGKPPSTTTLPLLCLPPPKRRSMFRN